MGIDASSSEDSEGISSVSEESEGSIALRKRRTGKGKADGSKVRVDPSLRKDSKLFVVDFKNDNNLEEGLTPPKLGKKTTFLILE